MPYQASISRGLVAQNTWPEFFNFNYCTRVRHNEAAVSPSDKFFNANAIVDICVSFLRPPSLNLLSEPAEGCAMDWLRIDRSSITTGFTDRKVTVSHHGYGIALLGCYVLRVGIEASL
jgi:hypothetical protein